MTTHTEEADELNIPAVLRDLRLQLIAARREADDCQRWLAQREADLTLSVEGKNETERKARLTLALSLDDTATKQREGLRAAQEHVARLEVEEQYLRDVRRAREWATRERHGVTWED